MAKSIHWILQQTARVNINRIEMMSVYQGPKGPKVAKAQQSLTKVPKVHYLIRIKSELICIVFTQ